MLPIKRLLASDIVVPVCLIARFFGLNCQTYDWSNVNFDINKNCEDNSPKMLCWEIWGKPFELTASKDLQSKVITVAQIITLIGLVSQQLFMRQSLFTFNRLIQGHHCHNSNLKLKDEFNKICIISNLKDFSDELGAITEKCILTVLFYNTRLSDTRSVRMSNVSRMCKTTSPKTLLEGRWAQSVLVFMLLI